MDSTVDHFTPLALRVRGNEREEKMKKERKKENRESKKRGERRKGEKKKGKEGKGKSTHCGSNPDP